MEGENDLPEGFEAIGELYRGELRRTCKWRERIDRPTNWAILTIVGILTWTFSSIERPHFVLLTGIIAVLLFSLIESRRYRKYVVWNSRVRLLEENFFAPLLSPQTKPKDEHWRNALARDLFVPAHKIGFLEAFSRRLRRIYLWLFLLLISTWFYKLLIHPHTTKSYLNLVKRAHVGPIYGSVVVGFILVFLGFILSVSLFLRGGKYGILERKAKGEIRPKVEKKRDWKEL